MNCLFLLFVFLTNQGTILKLFNKSGFGVVAKSPDTSVNIDPVKYEYGQKFLKKGDIMRIHCRGTNKKHKVDWYDPNGMLIQRQPKNRVYVQEHPKSNRPVRPPDHVLTITDARTNDTGAWECRSKDYVQSVELCVIDPAVFEETNEEESVDEGRSLSLTCQATGDPEPVISWYKDDRLITEETKDNKYIVGTKFNHRGLEGFLTIKSIHAEDQGMYTCVAEQRNDLVQHCSHESGINITLNVNHAPRFEDEGPEYIFAEPGDEINLNCQPSAYPPPSYRWLRELKISALKSIFMEYSDKDFQILENSTGSILQLKVNTSIFGDKFICKVNNSYGRAEMSYVIMKIEKPSKPEMSLLDATAHKLVFNVTWGEGLRIPVSGYEVQYFTKQASFTPVKDVDWSEAESIKHTAEYHFLPDRDFTLNVEHLNPDTEYWIRLRFYNSAGWSDWTFPPSLAATTPVEYLEYSNGSLYMEILTGLCYSGIVFAIGASTILIAKRL